MSSQERIIDGVSYISFNEAVKRLSPLKPKEVKELMIDQGVWPTAVTTKIGLSPETCISRKTPFLVELEEAESLAKIFCPQKSGNKERL